MNNNNNIYIYIEREREMGPGNAIHVQSDQRFIVTSPTFLPYGDEGILTGHEVRTNHATRSSIRCFVNPMWYRHFFDI